MPLGFTRIPIMLFLDTNASTNLIMTIILLPMAGAFILMIKKMIAKDEISIANSYLDSAYCGRINFDEIKKLHLPLCWENLT